MKRGASAASPNILRRLAHGNRGHRVAHGDVGPYRVEQRRFGYQLAGTFDQMAQDGKGLAAEADFLAPAPQLLVVRIKPEGWEEAKFRSHGPPLSKN